MEDISITEKRATQRISLKENVRFGVNSPEHDGMSQDLSPKGMSISSQKTLPVNSSIIIRFNSSNGDITAEGKVIWVSSPPGINSIMGIRFTGTNDELVNLYNKRARYKS